MPNRIIKESLCSSEKISSLSDFEFRLWVCLITQADDFGRGDARPAIIKGRAFPLRERVTAKDIDAAIHGLAAKGCVSLYAVGGKPYFWFPTWSEHQRIRECKAKFPGPEEADSLDNLPQLAASCGEMPPKSESNPNPNLNPKPNPTRTRDGAFDEFWKAYPRKVGKEAARKAFAKAQVDLGTILSAVEAQKRSAQWQKDGGQYIPNPATWLNQGRWEDEVPPERTDHKIPYGSAGEAPLGSLERDAVARMLGGRNGEED